MIFALRSLINIFPECGLVFNVVQFLKLGLS